MGDRSEIRGQVLEPPLPGSRLTLLSRDCRVQPRTPRTLLPPAVHTFSIPGFLPMPGNFGARPVTFLSLSSSVK